MLKRLFNYPVTKNVGIHAIDTYIPKYFVTQKSLEVFNNVPEGKYTKGLGQEAMSVCNPNEDINSITLSATKNLLKNYNLSPNDIGFLSVGHESPVDKSKSVKTTLMNLFPNNKNVEGVDCINACYGGTAALFNAVSWVQSEDWDGRYALVVMGDIAVYPAGPARPTGGAGSLALLIGKDAPIRLESGVRGSHCDDVYDFYKPDNSEYPRVDGHLSNECYINALKSSYFNYERSFMKKYRHEFNHELDTNYWIFHQPYEKLVRKSYSWCLGTGDNLNLMENEFNKKVAPSTKVGKMIGNTYTGSLYFGLLSLLSNKKVSEICGSRIMMFSYGSGLMSTMFSILVDDTNKSKNEIDNIVSTADIWGKLNSRQEIEPGRYNCIMKDRELGKWAKYSGMDSDNYYISSIDNLKRRSYKCK